MKLLMQYLAVAAAGSFGAVLRFFVGRISGRLFDTTFPVGTFVINITGCLILGWFIALVNDRMAVSETFRLAVTVGFVGAYTTFSTFVYESDHLLRTGQEIKAIANVVGSLAAGLIAVRLGLFLGSR
jgi:fluoride exporter